MQPATAKQPIRYCGARNRDGTACKRRAGWGTPYTYGRCSYHGGATPSGRAQAAREAARDVTAESGLHVPLDVSPIDSLLHVVRLTAGQLDHATRKVGELGENLADAQGRPVFWVTYQTECARRLAGFSKMALDAGVAERQVRLAERVGALLSGAMEDVLNHLGITDPAQRSEVVDLYSSKIMLLEAGDPDGP
jgi:hypothetical protein